MTRNLKIGLSIRLFTPNTGGLQLHAERLVEGLAGLGYSVRVLTKSITTVPNNSFWFCDPPHDQAPQDVAILRRRVGSLPMLWLAHKFCGRKATRPLGVELYCAAYMPSAWSCLNNSQLVHHVGQGSEMIGFVAEKVARRAGVPFLVQPTIHPGHWGDSELDFLLYQRADRLLAHTDYEREYFRDKGIRMPIDVVGNGIDDRHDGEGVRFREKHGLHGPMILFLGRKDPDKGYASLREAHGLMRERATLVCAGPEPRGILPLPKAGWPVLELGFLSEEEKHDALSACDIFCVPSIGESFGLVYMEAGRYRKPIVCRPIPVLEELLQGAADFVGERVGQCGGRLDAEELAGTLDALIKDANRRERLGEVAFEKSEKFLWPRVAEQFSEAYSKALVPRNRLHEKTNE